MGHTIFMTVFSSLVTVGMVLLIMWGMSNVDPRRKGYGDNYGEHSHSSEMFPTTRGWRDGADGEPAARNPGFVRGRPCGDRSIKQLWHRYPDVIGRVQLATGGAVGERVGFERSRSANCT